jgi:hypothetical protein
VIEDHYDTNRTATEHRESGVGSLHVFPESGPKRDGFGILGFGAGLGTRDTSATCKPGTGRLVTSPVHARSGHVSL